MLLVGVGVPKNRLWIAWASAGGMSAVGSGFTGSAGGTTGGRPGSDGSAGSPGSTGAPGTAGTAGAAGTAGSAVSCASDVMSVGTPRPQWRVSYCGRPRARFANAPGFSYGFGRFVPIRRG